jgi:glycine dehydrogenase subunit 1
VADPAAHPYIPNSAAATRDAMLAELGLADLDDLFSVVPDRLRTREALDLPPSLEAEADLRRYFREALAENRSCEETLSFLGGGCWQHHVPAVCDEIASRGELYTAFFGLGPGSTFGAYQALFEYQSLMAELLGLEISTVPTYDWGWAAGIALLMAVRTTGRHRVLVARSAGPQRRSQIAARMPDSVEVVEIPFLPETGLLAQDVLEGALAGAAALYVELPSYLGALETEIRSVAAAARDRGALLVAGVDPTSLGVVASPGSYGGDIAVGDLQPLGSHMSLGGASAGFLSTRLDERLVAELPAIYIAAFPTDREGELEFFWGNFEQTSYETRGTATDFTGCSSALTGIIAATYIAAMGPTGLRELGEGLLRRRTYLAERLATVPGIVVDRLSAPGFKELVVDFGGTGTTVADVNARLLEHGIFGGASLARDYPELGESALYCVTELHTQGDIDRLAETLSEVLR